MHAVNVLEPALGRSIAQHQGDMPRAAILGDETHQQDRSIQPTWFVPADDMSANVAGIFAGPPGPPRVRLSDTAAVLTASDAARRAAISDGSAVLTFSDAGPGVKSSDTSPRVDVEDHLSG